MDWLRSRAQSTPRTIALIAKDQRWTYGELDSLVDNTAGELLRAGVEPGDFVAVLMGNSPGFVRMVHALARIGAVLIPLNTRLTVEELRWQLQQVGNPSLVYDGSMAANAALLPSKNQLSADSLGVALTSSKHRPTPSLSPKVDPLQKLHSIIFTSGTTGFPKGVMLTYANHFWSATASAFRLGHHRDDRWLCCLPLYHVGGLAVILRSCLYGITCVLHDRFDVEAVDHSLSAQEISLISLVPTMLHRLLELGGVEHWSRRLRMVLLGGAAASPELVAMCQDRHIPVATTYGLTEAASQVATMVPEEVRLKPGSVGRPLMFSSVRIVGEEGESLPVGAYGEIVVNGKMLMAGYYGDAEATYKSLRHGELYTGDIGYLDEDGDLWIVQRRDDIIVTGGENVYPAEVEAVLRQHPAVVQACVIGLHDREWGQQVVAMIVRRLGSSVSPGEISQFCRQRLAGYKIPRQVHFVETLPQTASGKIHRRAVAELLENALSE